jgi:hypothetical protein
MVSGVSSVPKAKAVAAMVAVTSALLLPMPLLLGIGLLIINLPVN